MKTHKNDAGKHPTQDEIARKMGVSATTVSQWLQGKYLGDTGAIDTAAEQMLTRELERKAKPKVRLQFVKTRVASAVREVCKIAHLDGEIGVITGDAGLGKTEAVKDYAKNNEGVVLIEADLGYSARNLFQEIHRRIGLDGAGGIRKLFSDIVDKLSDTGWVIIVDEAEHLPYKALELIRRIHDKAGVGLVLVGMPRLIANLRGKQGEYKQLYSRVGVYRQLDKLELADVERLVVQVYPQANGLCKCFLECSDGNARMLTKLLARTVRLEALNPDQGLSKELIREARTTLIA
ncbi:MAG: AAA family ATPase [Candidatus Kapabacteria bacterium]|nr:AAA family ATPase [Candidatus Kapabacteria bacterium]